MTYILHSQHGHSFNTEGKYEKMGMPAIDDNDRCSFMKIEVEVGLLSLQKNPAIAEAYLAREDIQGLEPELLSALKSAVKGHFKKY